MTDLFKGLLAGHPQIGQIVRLADRHHQVQFVDIGLQRALGPTYIRHQSGDRYTGAANDAANYIVGIRQVRNSFGRNERCCFDLRKPGQGQLVD
ncbi:hypothetical protein D3C78_1342310 [compost metagenome]